MAKGNEPIFGTISTKGVEMQESSQVVPDEKLGIGNRGKGKKIVLASVSVIAILAIAAMVFEERKPEHPPLDLSIAPVSNPTSAAAQGVVQRSDTTAPAVVPSVPNSITDPGVISTQASQPALAQETLQSAQNPSAPAQLPQGQPAMSSTNQVVASKVPSNEGRALPIPSPATIPAAPASQQVSPAKADAVLVSGVDPAEAKQAGMAPVKEVLDPPAKPKVKKAVAKKPQASETKREAQVPAVQEEGVTREEIIILSGEK